MGVFMSSGASDREPVLLYKRVTCFILSPAQLTAEMREEYRNPTDDQLFDEIRDNFSNAVKRIDKLKKLVEWFPNKRDDIYSLTVENLGLYKVNPGNLLILINLFPDKQVDLSSKFDDEPLRPMCP